VRRRPYSCVFQFTASPQQNILQHPSKNTAMCGSGTTHQGRSDFDSRLLIKFWHYGRHDKIVIYALLGNYVAYSVNFLPTFRGNLSVPSSRDDSRPMNMGTISCHETSIKNYRKLCNFPEERRSHPLRAGSLKSRMENPRFKSIDCVTIQGPSFCLEAYPHG
jgi:hypothetical protein